jgi:hypothetical protein
VAVAIAEPSDAARGRRPGDNCIRAVWLRYIGLTHEIEVLRVALGRLGLPQ